MKTCKERINENLEERKMRKEKQIVYCSREVTKYYTGVPVYSAPGLGYCSICKRVTNWVTKKKVKKIQKDLIEGNALLALHSRGW